MAKPKSDYCADMIASNSAWAELLRKCILQILHILLLLYRLYFSKKLAFVQSAFTCHTLDIVNDSPQINSQLASFELTTFAEVRNDPCRPKVNPVTLTHSL